MNKLNDTIEEAEDGIGICGWILVILSCVLVFFTFPISIFMCIKLVKEYERAVILRLGRKAPGGAKGPGLFFILPCLDTMMTIDLRTITSDIPPQEILTKDSVTVSVDAVIYYRIFDPVLSVINVANAQYSTRLLAATSLRNILGTKTLQEILQDREHIAQMMRENVDVATDPWGVKVERVEVKDVRLPASMQRSMATEAEASREARAKVIAAEGEQKASLALKQASDIIGQSSAALQLRYLQTLTQISAEKNSTIVINHSTPYTIVYLFTYIFSSLNKIFPIPIELLRAFQ
jgi:erythrocyte band 7 integral membrane protein